MTKRGYYPKVMGSTDTYTKKQVDKTADRLDRLHYLNKEKIDALKRRIASLEQTVTEILLLRRKK